MPSGTPGPVALCCVEFVRRSGLGGRRGGLPYVHPQHMPGGAGGERGGKLHPLGLKEQRHAGRLWLSTAARGDFGQSRVAMLVSGEGNLLLGQQVAGSLCESSWGQAALWEQSKVWLLVLENKLKAGEARREEDSLPAARSEQRVSLCTAMLREIGRCCTAHCCRNAQAHAELFFHV